MRDDDPPDPDDGGPDPAVGALWSARPYLNGLRAPAGAADEPATSGVRPFVVTRGRTTEQSDLAIEAQVIATKRGMAALDGLTFEYRDIVELCSEPLAVAEVSARLRLQLGVTRVLLRDLTRAGHVTTFEPDVGLSVDVQTIMRVIDGLRQLS